MDRGGEVADGDACAPSTSSLFCAQASDRLYYLINTVLEARAALAGSERADAAAQAAQAQLQAHEGPGAQVLHECRAALADDLNTPAAIAALSATLRDLNDLLSTRKVLGGFGVIMRYVVH